MPGESQAEQVGGDQKKQQKIKKPTTPAVAVSASASEDPEPNCLLHRGSRSDLLGGRSSKELCVCLFFLLFPPTRKESPASRKEKRTNKSHNFLSKIVLGAGEGGSGTEGTSGLKGNLKGALGSSMARGCL